MILSDLALYAGSVLLVLGALFSLLAAIGVWRLPDLLSRMHAASKAGVVGGGLVLLAVAIMCFDAGIALRAIMGLVFLLITTPIAAHLLARANYTGNDQASVTKLLPELKSKTLANRDR